MQYTNIISSLSDRGNNVHHGCSSLDALSSICSWAAWPETQTEWHHQRIRSNVHHACWVVVSSFIKQIMVNTVGQCSLHQSNNIMNSSLECASYHNINRIETTCNGLNDKMGCRHQVIQFNFEVTVSSRCRYKELVLIAGRVFLTPLHNLTVCSAYI